jgi:hypothetical protein
MQHSVYGVCNPSSAEVGRHQQKKQEKAVALEPKDLVIIPIRQNGEENLGTVKRRNRIRLNIPRPMLRTAVTIRKAIRYCSTVRSELKLMIRPAKKRVRKARIKFDSGPASAVSAIPLFGF